ncbi:MAG: DUF5615 family PIN-like protein [Candidatus Marinimicrobia bacterium]|nr:DUF5615 family PIN-like protein [Candidatus Neomarinimicrobiota bacterium]MCF7828418.1 DUF5615 family PIN-like protein [Candidatus Neomarinimicrobiota bacterium]MCF7880988.1 DUF5615 family PIN-like protein [Candidatus Neomarinimicrobiota bacterium]
MLRFLIDESVDFRLTTYLTESPHLRWSAIVQDSPGISDDAILQQAHETQSILITEDSDFGEWIFVHRQQSSGVIFLRYHPTDIQKIGRTLNTVIKEYGDSLYRKFVVVTTDKIRIREI